MKFNKKTEGCFKNYQAPVPKGYRSRKYNWHKVLGFTRRSVNGFFKRTEEYAKNRNGKVIILSGEKDITS